MAQKTDNKTQPSRPPIVVVLGHVDHGKTTLLDTIRQSDVASKEYGGITQGIGAYQVTLEDKSRITFIDTPGHEAFTQMRSQGTKVADIAILVVAANDSVMPQTVEAIKIIKEAGIPFIVAANKIDLPEANVDKLVQDLLRHEVMVESYGGEVPLVKISAKKGDGIKELLEMIDLLAKMNELSNPIDDPILGTIIESRMDKGRGPVATVIVRAGILKVGDKVFVNGKETKIRALIDYHGQQLQEATPGTPAEILGLSEVPPVGSSITQTAILDNEEQKQTTTAPSTSDSAHTLTLILKADTVGSLDALKAKIPANVTTLGADVGDISEADVLLAKSTKALILGFNVRAPGAVLKLAETEKVLVRTYKIIYELLDELNDAADGMLEEINVETVLGVGQIIAEFPFDKTKVAGTKVTDGRLARGDSVRVTRPDPQSETGEKIVGTGRIKSLRVVKDELNKVEKGKECGVLFDAEFDFRPGDAIISYN